MWQADIPDSELPTQLFRYWPTYMANKLTKIFEFFHVKASRQEIFIVNCCRRWKQRFLETVQRGIYQSCTKESSKILGEGHWYWINDFVATFGVNDLPISMALCSLLVWGGLLDIGFRLSVVDNWYWFPTSNKLFTERSSKIVEDLRRNWVW